MTHSIPLIDLATKYHEALPNRIRAYLNGRGIPDELIDSHLLGWNGWRVTIPIYNRQGAVVFFKLAKDPEDSRPSPKMLTSSGAAVELYGWQSLIARPPRIIVCEGEFDRLVLEAQGFSAVTSTAGSTCFRPEWAQELKEIDEVYVCFDRNAAGRNGTGIVSVMLPHARFIELPAEVGEGGDLTDFFVRLGRSRSEFEKLLEQASPIPPALLASKSCKLPSGVYPPSYPLSSRIERIKRELPIEVFVARYVQLKSIAIGAALTGRCPFHNDRFSSFTVCPRTGTYYCFICRARGDVISFLAAKEQISFSEAVEKLDRIIPLNAEAEPNGHDIAA